ncbi:MAG TPA: ATP-binding protein [Thermoguttaceae bacterium]|nr:ATP-binding protein [Thermoguttaceae bacterium]
MSAEQTPRLLVVEDNEPELHLLCEILREEGFEPVGCGSAAEALVHISKGDFRVAVVDLRLPDLSGNQLLELGRHINDAVQIIIYSGAASEDSIEEAMSLGAFACLEKTSDMSELLRTIRQACDHSPGRAPAAARAVAKPRAKPTRQTGDRTHRYQGNQEFEEFVSVVAHDLRSPLLTISGYSQILGDEYRDRLDEDASEYLEHITAGVTLANRLIEDLLDYSRVGRSDLPPTHVDLDSVLEQVKKNLRTTIEESHAELCVEHLPTIAGNREQLTQLFFNLVDNALKFRADVDTKIQVCSTRGEKGWEFAVEDNGIGLAAEHFGDAFQVFWRLQGKKFPGTGIGLAVCKKIVQCHGGRIWLESTLGQGTTVRFSIPDRTDTLESLID